MDVDDIEGVRFISWDDEEVPEWEKWAEEKEEAGSGEVQAKTASFGVKDDDVEYPVESVQNVESLTEQQVKERCPEAVLSESSIYCHLVYAATGKYALSSTFSTHIACSYSILATTEVTALFEHEYYYSCCFLKWQETECIEM